MIASSQPADSSITIAVTGASGRAYEVRRRAGCPEFPTRWSCIESFWIYGGSADDKELQVTATRGADRVETVVEPRADSCGHDVAYVRLAQRTDGMKFDDALYVSPCAEPDL